MICSHLHIKETWADPTAPAWKSNVDDGIPVGAPWALILVLPSHLHSQTHFSSENALSLKSGAFAAFPFSSPCTFTEGHALHWGWTENSDPLVLFTSSRRVISEVLSTLCNFPKRWSLHSSIVSWKMLEGCAGKKNTKINDQRSELKSQWTKWCILTRH